MSDENNIQLKRIADALEAIAPKVAAAPRWSDASAFVFQPPQTLAPVGQVHALPLHLLKGIDSQKARLYENTKRFARGLPANNALLWGARGTGKSALVKAIHAELRNTLAGGLKLVEIHREDIHELGRLLSVLSKAPVRAILFCDDLSFDSHDSTYRALKTVLEGGLEGRPENVLFYATSNRRHLMPREMIENERSTAIHPDEVIEEKISLSDRFGLWIGFHNLSQDVYLSIIEAYAQHFALKLDAADLKARALEWSMTRGGRSGRVAWQFIEDLAGELGQRLAVAVIK